MPPTATSLPAGHDQPVDVSDHPMVWRWFRETARHDPEGFACLARGNVPALLALWGAPQAKRRAKGREWTHAWQVAEEGLNWLVMSGPVETRYVLRCTGDRDAMINDPRVAAGAVAFLQRLLTHLAR